MKHNPRENIIVLKFGGTSIRDRVGFEKAYKHVNNAIKHGNKVICVVSAMGRSGDAYATDTLRNLIGNYVTQKEQDRLISVGETISSVVFADFLIHKGLRAISLSTKEIGILTDRSFSNANILAFDDTFIRSSLLTHDCLVIPGFQGITENGETTTLGRGGSDTTAIFLGIELNAKEIRIVSDVDGIYSGDPRIIRNAYRYPFINYKQLETITRNGSKVLHEKAARFATNHHAPIVFCHIDDGSKHTKVTTLHVPFFNVTSKHNYYRFRFKEYIESSIAERYLGDYFVAVQDENDFCELLDTLKINYEKELGYSKISILIDHGKLHNKFAYVRNEQLIDCLNMIHDMYLNRG